MLTQHINLLQSTMSFFKSFFSVPFLVQFRDYSWLVRGLVVRCYLKKACLITLKNTQSQNWSHSEAYYKHTQIHFRNSQITKNFTYLWCSFNWKIALYEHSVPSRKQMTSMLAEVKQKLVVFPYVKARCCWFSCC